MVRLNFSIQLEYQIADHPGDFIFNIHAAQTPRQTVVSERLDLNRAVQSTIESDMRHGARFIRMKADPGLLSLRYAATVDINHFAEMPANLHEMSVAQLSAANLPYIYPSRYCQSDKLRKYAAREFGHLQQGYGRIKAIEDWVRQRTTFKSGCSNDSTSALDTLLEQTGVCRDFAHLMIALCRAINIPARFATGIDYGAPPEMGPTDFHAYVEVLLSGRWYLFDPTGVSPPMGLIRIGTGRDAADVSFATLFGAVMPNTPIIEISALDDPLHGFTKPYYCDSALSTD
jgi:transglutaminase-like putative cysteine protease